MLTYGVRQLLQRLFVERTTRLVGTISLSGISDIRLALPVVICDVSIRASRPLPKPVVFFITFLSYSSTFPFYRFITSAASALYANAPLDFGS